MAPHKTVAEENREYWNSETNFYEKEKNWAEAISRQYTEELRQRREWLGLPAEKTGKLRLLDVACGPGMLSNALFDFVDEARGVDIADRMVDIYNEKARNRGLSPEQMSAVQGNIVADDPSEESGLSSSKLFGFDMVGIANALHHMADPALAVRKLVERLKPGGTLLIVEFVGDLHESPTSGGSSGHAHAHHEGQGGHHHHHGHDHGEAQQQSGGHAHGVAHFGFSEQQLQKLLLDAGCTEVEISLIEEPIKFPPSLGSIERTGCFAKGKKGI